MGIWIELHCDRQAPASDERGRYACVSGSGNQPGVMTLKKPATVARALIATALKNGWVRDGDNLICPVCAAYWRNAANADLGAAKPSHSKAQLCTGD